MFGNIQSHIKLACNFNQVSTTLLEKMKLPITVFEAQVKRNGKSSERTWLVKIQVKHVKFKETSKIQRGSNYSLFGKV